jgi:hypothetical protein
MDMPTVRQVLEIAAAALDCDVGHWRIEVQLDDGHVTRLYRHEGPVYATALGRFDRNLPQLLDELMSGVRLGDE